MNKCKYYSSVVYYTLQILVSNSVTEFRDNVILRLTGLTEVQPHLRKEWQIFCSSASGNQPNTPELEPGLNIESRIVVKSVVRMRLK